MHAMVLTYSLRSAHVTHSGQPNVIDELPYLLLDSLRLRIIAANRCREMAGLRSSASVPAPSSSPCA
jgi:hypothetical protein